MLNGMQIRYSVNRTDQNGNAYMAYLAGCVTATNRLRTRAFCFPRAATKTPARRAFVFGGESGMRAVDGTLYICSGTAPAAKTGPAGYNNASNSVLRDPPAAREAGLRGVDVRLPRISDVGQRQGPLEFPTNKYAGCPTPRRLGRSKTRSSQTL